MDLLAIVILNYNGKAYLEKFLSSVVRHSGEHAVYVADNGSTDDSVHWLKEHFPQVRLVVNASNLGFAGGYNEALKQISAKYYCLLNSDVEVTAGWIDPVLSLLENNEKIAAVQPKILDYNYRKHFEHAGGVGGYLDVLGYPFTRGRMFNFREEDLGQYDTDKQCFWASGACFFVRADIFKGLHGFDSDFFAHMEEIDLCWRIQLLGYQVWATPKSTVYHVGGGTLDYQNPRKTFLNFRNSLAMLYKNLPAYHLYRLILIRLVLDGTAGIRYFLAGFPRSCWAIVQAHFSFYAELPKWHRKRKEIKTLRNLGNPVERYEKSIVSAYFFHRYQKFSELKGIK
ncbi:dTDP-Rha--alpha-D-GlcNAc-pyrophosphate polyprenol alpha-3-L-rhamnosyltransferase [Siphonobacter sp. SORGH_AS_0500]|uniref:glycosyltransferase family 2 protein n=1 Tax=Siphonobacter sp. SORGH_AS_0500 TaxID=1864824 RepID=UPI000CA70420|nr:glycosyltransferase family 2 protein [Siphonobacter sp. SORGH_AS_0500]PKK37655.1 dTDP-Rha--alpha-D-GlcNAc-pyrophosphate polyprenol alpha-3-L-rhamnosyltransferase [Siphonobacter sp. SORGH_AS_0500]